MSRVFISYRHVYPDQEIARFLAAHLTANRIEVFTDKQISVGTKWADEIGRQIKASDYFVVLLSKQSILSDMVRQEVKLAHGLTQEAGRRFVILPVRVDFEGELPYDLGAYLDPIHFLLWKEGDDLSIAGGHILAAIEQSAELPHSGRAEREGASRLGVEELASVTEGVGAPLPSADHRIVSETGTVSPNSPFYIERKADSQLLRQVIAEGTTTVVKGARQIGKSSLLARAYSTALGRDEKAFYLDFQLVDVQPLETLDALLLYLARKLARALRVEPKPDAFWDSSLGAKENLTEYIDEVLLPGAGSPLHLLLDEVDLLFTRPYRDQFFATLRGWHNLRATREAWNRLNIVIAHSTEPYLWIQDINQSPFNVGLSIRLDDFSHAEVMELNARYGGRRRGNEEMRLLTGLLGGHPFLLRQALFTLASSNMSVRELLDVAASETGPFGDHLRRYVWFMQQSEGLRRVLREVLRRNACDSEADFQRLKAAGLVKGETRHALQMRCRLYSDYFRKHL